MKYITLLLLLLTTQLIARAQQHNSAAQKPVEIIGDSIGNSAAIFVGEVHGLYEGDAFKFQLIRWAYQRYGISNVVLEMGKADAYLFNRYFQNADTTILTYYGHSKDVLERLAQWERVYRDTKCTLVGIDFEREPYVTAVLSILKNHVPAQQTKLYSYLNTLANSLDGKDDFANRKKHSKNYKKAQDIFRTERAELQRMLQNDYSVVEGILLNPASEGQMNKRDEAMLQNLKVQCGNTSFICIVGAGHTHFQENTLLKRYLADNRKDATLLINTLCKNCYNTSYYGTVLSPLAGDFEERDQQYFEKVCEQYYKPGAYVLVNQRILEHFPSAFYPVPTYYAVLKDQPKW